MTLLLTKTELRNKSKIKEKLAEYLPSFRKIADHYSEDEVFHLVLSAISVNEYDAVHVEKYRSREKYHLNYKKIEDWIKEKLVPNTILIGPNDSDLLKLVIFSLAMPYKMLKGGTRATMTEKTRRTKQRDFEQIFSDTFIGKIGEIAFKKFLNQKFGRDLKLDWDISTDIHTFKSDLPDSKCVVSIKSTDTLESIWAEAPKNADYGIFVKVALPKDFFIKILAHISSLKKFLNFVEEHLEKDDQTGRDLLSFVEKTAYQDGIAIKAYIYGFFKTSDNTLKKKGEEIPFLGEVHEDKHLVECNKLKCSLEGWKQFFEQVL